MKRFRNLITIGLLTFLCIICNSLASAQPHTIDKVFTVEPGGTLRLSIPAGTVTVTGWEYNEVQVKAEMDGSPRYLDGLEFRLEQEGNDVIVNMRHRARRWFRRLESGDARIKMTIYIPYQYHARIDLSAGSAMIENIDGDAIVKSSAGTITIADVYGNVSAQTRAGTITASLLKDMGSVDLKTSTGTITIMVPEDFSGEFDLSTNIGRVESSLSTFQGSGSRLKFGHHEGAVSVSAKASIGTISVVPMR
jgi:hypothetical protein